MWYYAEQTAKRAPDPYGLQYHHTDTIIFKTFAYLYVTHRGMKRRRGRRKWRLKEEGEEENGKKIRGHTEFPRCVGTIAAVS